MDEPNVQTVCAPCRSCAHAAALFDAGFVVRTPGVMAALFAARVTESSLIQRHESGDFGDVDWETERSNWHALRAGGVLRSLYTLDGSARIHVVSTPELRTTTLSLLGTA